MAKAQSNRTRAEKSSQPHRLEKLYWCAGIVATFVAALALFLQYGLHLSGHQPAPVHPAPPIISPAPPLQVSYTVNMMLPSLYNDADILVDGSPAKITERTPTFVTLLVGAQDAPHKFQVKKGSVIREETIFVSSNQTILKPFQY